MSGGIAFGGAGNDTIYFHNQYGAPGFFSGIRAHGGTGNDNIFLYDVRDSIVYLGDGDDEAQFIELVDSRATGNTMFGGAGNDKFTYYGTRSVFFGDAGNDLFDITWNLYSQDRRTTYITADGGVGDDRFNVDINADGFEFSTLLGGVGTDSYVGPVRHSWIDLGADDDTIDALIGDYSAEYRSTRIFGGAGNDLITVSPDPYSYDYPGPRYAALPISPIIDPGEGNDILTVNNVVSGGKPVIILVSPGDDRIVVNSGLQLQVERLAGDRETVILAPGAPLVLDLRAFNSILFPDQLQLVLANGQVTIILPDDQQIAIQGTGITGSAGSSSCSIWFAGPRDPKSCAATTSRTGSRVSTGMMSCSASAERTIWPATRATTGWTAAPGLTSLPAAWATISIISTMLATGFVEVADEGIADRVFATVSYVLGAGQSIETMSTNDAAGTAAINFTGNGLGQLIFGNAGANTLVGGGGADTLLGLGGGDLFFGDGATACTMQGGMGDDYYYVYQRQFACRIRRRGQTTVSYTTVGYTLSAGREIEALTTADQAGTAAITLTGNALGQLIFGNAGANIADRRRRGRHLIGYGGTTSCSAMPTRPRPFRVGPGRLVLRPAHRRSASSSSPARATTGY